MSTQVQSWKNHFLISGLIVLILSTLMNMLFTAVFPTLPVAAAASLALVIGFTFAVAYYTGREVSDWEKYKGSITGFGTFLLMLQFWSWQEDNRNDLIFAVLGAVTGAILEVLIKWAAGAIGGL
ncbi:hypothetical protein [Emcibacter sp.]|uniref:hypothetical protein n=1 Tax=Emcibacter sp. TaxID=1979954 RepID=UPI002AA751EC|nr:hypothetical protein [Emcibacter sp.]